VGEVFLKEAIQRVQSKLFFIFKKEKKKKKRRNCSEKEEYFGRDWCKE
jgi:hypothetical protein